MDECERETISTIEDIAYLIIKLFIYVIIILIGITPFLYKDTCIFSQIKQTLRLGFKKIIPGKIKYNVE